MKLRILIMVFGLLLTSFGTALTAQDDAAPSPDSRFHDRGLLAQTLTADDLKVVDDAQAHLDQLYEKLITAQDELQDARDSDTTTDDRLAALQARESSLEQQVGQAEDSVQEAQQSADEEAAAVEEAIGRLSEDQVLALNQGLNNAASSGSIADIDARDLQILIDGKYDAGKISDFIKTRKEAAKLSTASDDNKRKPGTRGDGSFPGKPGNSVDESVAR